MTCAWATSRDHRRRTSPSSLNYVIETTSITGFSSTHVNEDLCNQQLVRSTEAHTCGPNPEFTTPNQFAELLRVARRSRLCAPLPARECDRKYRIEISLRNCNQSTRISGPTLAITPCNAAYSRRNIPQRCRNRSGMALALPRRQHGCTSRVSGRTAARSRS